MRRLFNPRHLLPLMIFFGVLILGLRLNNLWQVAASGTAGEAGPEVVSRQRDSRHSSGCLAMTCGSRPASSQPPTAPASGSPISSIITSVSGTSPNRADRLP